MYFYSENIIGCISADITMVMPSGDIYAGKFDRSKEDFNSDLKEQKIWQITKTRVSQDNGTTTYETLYPEGCKAFAYAWSDAETLSYSYNKN